MISRDRFEVILESISKGSAIENARNRLEMIFSAIAEKIGTGGGGSAITKDVIGEWTIPTDGTYFQNSYTTTKSMSDYDYLIVTVETFQTSGSNTIISYNDFVVEYSEGNRFTTIKPANLNSDTAQTYWQRYTFTNTTTITVNGGYANSGWITKIVGIKLGGE